MGSYIYLFTEKTYTAAHLRKRNSECLWIIKTNETWPLAHNFQSIQYYNTPTLPHPIPAWRGNPSLMPFRKPKRVGAFWIPGGRVFHRAEVATEKVCKPTNLFLT